MKFLAEDFNRPKLVACFKMVKYQAIFQNGINARLLGKLTRKEEFEIGHTGADDVVADVEDFGGAPSGLFIFMGLHSGLLSIVGAPVQRISITSPITTGISRSRLEDSQISISPMFIARWN